MADNADNDDIWGDESNDDFTPNNPFGLKDDEDDDTTEEPEVEETEEEEEPEEGDGEEEAEEEPEEEFEHDPDAIEPYEYMGRWYTSLEALKRDFEAAQDHIKGTSREERTPLSEALTGGAGSWESDWAALTPNDQALLQSEFQRDPAGLAMKLAQDIRIVGKPITEFVFNEWAKIEPYRAMNWAMEEQKRVNEALAAADYQEPQYDPYLQSYVEQQQSAEAEAILEDNIHGWTPEIAAEVAEFIQLNGEALGLRDADVSTPEGMADFVAKSYYWLQGLKADAAAAPVQEDTPKAKSSKKKAYSPAKSSATHSTSGSDPELDDIFGSDESSFRLPLK